MRSETSRTVVSFFAEPKNRDQTPLLQRMPRPIRVTEEPVRRPLLFGMLAGVLLSSAAARAEQTTGFTLETGSPDALCPALEVTREAVTRRLGSLLVEGRRGWRARYTIGHAPAGTPRDFVRLELFSPEGRVELVRDLPIEQESCRTMAEVIALVLDRYFRGLVGEQGQPPDASEPSVEPGPPSGPPTVEQHLALSPAPTMQRRLSLQYSVSHPTGRPWLGLRGSTVMGGHWELALDVRMAVTPARQRVLGGAIVESRAFAGRSILAWRLPLQPVLLHGGPLVSVTAEHARTQGLAVHQDRTRVLWAAGAEVGLSTPVSRALFIHSAISAEYSLASGHFFIQEQEVLAPSRLTLGWCLGFGFH